MKAYEVTAFGLDNLRLSERPAPVPGPGEVAIHIKAVSLNRRDLLVVQGIYNPKQKLPVIPVSDGAGVISAVGSGVTGFAVGDRVVPAFFPSWADGDKPSSAMLADSRGGHGGDGLLAETIIAKADAVFAIPPHLSFEEAACLPCAGLTAWSAICSLGNVQPGETVLIQGTGGVSLFALQFAKARGAKVILTSSSDEKLAKGKALGADHLVNYRTHPRWGDEVRKLAPDGLDHVVEVAGAETLEQTIRLTRPGGNILLIGVLSGAFAQINLPLVLMRRIRIQGVTCGSLAEHKAMSDFITQTKLKPVIGAEFSFDDTVKAFEAMGDNAVFGKIVIRV